MRLCPVCTRYCTCLLYTSEVKGNFNTALCYTPALDGKAEEQIRLVCDEEAFRDSKIRILSLIHI